MADSSVTVWIASWEEWKGDRSNWAIVKKNQNGVRVETVLKLVSSMKGQWLWSVTTIVAVSQAIVTAFLIMRSGWQQPSVEATRKFTENHWLTSLRQSNQFDHDFNRGGGACNKFI